MELIIRIGHSEKRKAQKLEKKFKRRVKSFWSYYYMELAFTTGSKDELERILSRRYGYEIKLEEIESVDYFSHGLKNSLSKYSDIFERKHVVGLIQKQHSSTGILSDDSEFSGILVGIKDTDLFVKYLKTVMLWKKEVIVEMIAAGLIK